MKWDGELGLWGFESGVKRRGLEIVRRMGDGEMEDGDLKMGWGD